MKNMVFLPMLMVFLLLPAALISADAFNTIRMSPETICHSANLENENLIQFVAGFGIGHAAHGDAVELPNLDFGSGAQSVRIIFSAGDSPAHFQVILDDLNNSPVAAIATSGTGGWTEADAAAFYADFTQPVTGTRTVYLRWVDGIGSLYQVDFSPGPAGDGSAFPHWEPAAAVVIEPEPETGPPIARAADGDFLIASFADGSHWHPEFGDMVMRDGLLTFTPMRTGRTYRTDGRYWFPQIIDLSEFAKGYLQVEVMVSDILMLDCEEATIELSSENLANLKWEFNIAGTPGDGKSPQVPVEAGVWTLLTVPLYQHGWKDGGGIDFTKVNRFDFHILGIQHQMEEGSVHFRNLQVILQPASGGAGRTVIIIIAALVVLGIIVVFFIKNKVKSKQ